MIAWNRKAVKVPTRITAYLSFSCLSFCSFFSSHVQTKNSGPARQGRALFRTGAAPAPLSKTDHGRAAWRARPENPTAVRWSPGSLNPQALVDGSFHSGWRAQTATDAWVIVDLGGYYEITELDLTLTFRDNNETNSGRQDAPRDLRLQKAPSGNITLT